MLLRYEWEGTEPAPGQFVGVRAGDSFEPYLPRPFFVHEFAEREISLFFKVRGGGTRALADSGEKILVSTPRGCGFDLDVSGPVVLVGGGVWTAPLRLLGRRLRERGISHDVFLEVPPAAPQEYVSWLGEAYPEAEMVRTSGAPGSITDALGGLGGYEAVYVSGDRATLGSIRGASPDAQLAVRERMGCMDGSCHGCAVPVHRDEGISYERACVEGPVFRAGDLAW